MYTAVAAAILGAAFGSSEFLINGPTNAISVMVAANAALFAAHGDPVQAIILLTLMVGAIQFLAGLLRAGSLTRFVSEPVLTGFTAGAGVYIVINQIPSFLGIEKAAIPATVFGFTLPKAAIFDLVRLSFALHTTAPTALAVGAFTFLTIRGTAVAGQATRVRLPATFIAVVLATVMVAVFGLDHGNRGAPREGGARHPAADPRPSHSCTCPHIDLPGHAKPGGRSARDRGSWDRSKSIAIGKLLAGRAGHPFDANRQLLGEGFATWARRWSAASPRRDRSAVRR